MDGWGGRTEEEAFPNLEELDGGKGSAAAEVCLEGGEGFFAGWTVFGVVLVSDRFQAKSNDIQDIAVV